MILLRLEGVSKSRIECDCAFCASDDDEEGADEEGDENAEDDGANCCEDDSTGKAPENDTDFDLDFWIGFWNSCWKLS